MPAFGASVDTPGNIANSDENQPAADRVDPGDGDGGAAGAAERLVNPQEQRLGLELRILLELPDGFERGQAGLQPMTEAIGHQDGEVAIVPCGAPGVARHLFPGLATFTAPK